MIQYSSVVETLYCLKTSCLPIFEQLRLEEALLRADHQNYCLINIGSPPAVVMGISGSLDRDLNSEVAKRSGVPIIRRYSGGGTVVVDEETLFVSLILQRGVLSFPCYPRQVMVWTGQFYAPQLGGHGFAVCENDYVLGERKFGGNAQSITKERFVHHSTLLWDYDDGLMDVLRLPERVPNYRKQRSHSDFLCRLCDFLPCREGFIDGLLSALATHFRLESLSLSTAQGALSLTHRRSTIVEALQ